MTLLVTSAAGASGDGFGQLATSSATREDAKARRSRIKQRRTFAWLRVP
jgi:hypothetical protein